MSIKYEISPKIGIARLGNSKDGFYLTPETLGELPVVCDKYGTPCKNGKGELIRTKIFKDLAGNIKRQAARFRVIKILEGESNPVEVDLSTDEDIESIRWTVHIANKKPCWYKFQELLGDQTYGEWNSYKAQKVPLRNDGVKGEDRQSLITDPGPRSIDCPGDRVLISVDDVPSGYKHANFPPRSTTPDIIECLGELRMNDHGQLIVLGAFGKSGGTEKLTQFLGDDGQYDDTSDGYVMATVFFKDGTSLDLVPSWILTCSPDFAPEITNIVTLDNLFFDLGIRFKGLDPNIYDASKVSSEGAKYDPFEGFNMNFHPNFQRDIQPIIQRCNTYRWVANVPSMEAFAHPNFDIRDNSPENKPNRLKYFSYFRIPVPPEKYKFINEVGKGPNDCFAEDGTPLMPVNAGDNPITNKVVNKFLALTPTQYFFLNQWAEGKFMTEQLKDNSYNSVTTIDRGILGNTVGLPLCPGIEVPWIVRNPLLFDAPYHFKVRHWNGSVKDLIKHYYDNGLSLTADPEQGVGAEPGDITKRLACPWKTDFFECTLMPPNMNNPRVTTNDNGGVLAPPAFFAYWWPPQSPMMVIAGARGGTEQVLDGLTSNVFASNLGLPIIPMGMPVEYTRGISSFQGMVDTWSFLGFIVNQGDKDYPFFVESERNFAAIGQYKEINS